MALALGRISVLALVLGVAGCEQTSVSGTAGFSGNVPGSITVRNGIRVFPVDANLFEVSPGASARTDDYWCGASEYARRKLGAPWSARIYVASGIQPGAVSGRRSTVLFTLNPEAAGVTPVDLTVRTGFTVGDNLSLNMANTRCRMYNPVFDR